MKSKFSPRQCRDEVFRGTVKGTTTQVNRSKKQESKLVLDKGGNPKLNEKGIWSCPTVCWQMVFHLQGDSVAANFATTLLTEKTYQMDCYNPDGTVSVGYPVKSKRGTPFRIWAWIFSRNIREKVLLWMMNTWAIFVVAVILRGFGAYPWYSGTWKSILPSGFRNLCHGHWLWSKSRNSDPIFKKIPLAIS